MSDIMVTSVYVIVALKLCSEVGNDEYIVLSYFGDRRVSAFEVIQEGGEGGGGGLRGSPFAGSNKKIRSK